MMKQQFHATQQQRLAMMQQQLAMMQQTQLTQQQKQQQWQRQQHQQRQASANERKLGEIEAEIQELNQRLPMDERLREKRKTVWTPERLWKLEKNKRELALLNKREHALLLRRARADNKKHARCMAGMRKELEKARKGREEKEKPTQANQPTDRNVSESCNSDRVDAVVNVDNKERNHVDRSTGRYMNIQNEREQVDAETESSKINHDSPSPSVRGTEDRPMAIWQAIARTLTPFTNSGNGAGDRDTDDQVEPELLSASTEGEDVPMSTPDVSPGLPSEGNTSKTGVPSTQDPLNSASLNENASLIPQAMQVQSASDLITTQQPQLPVMCSSSRRHSARTLP